MVLEHLRSAGVHQSQEDTIRFSSLSLGRATISVPKAASWRARRERRAAIFIGPEFGTVTRVDLVAAAREASDARFDVLIACAFSFDAHAAELSSSARCRSSKQG